MKIFSPLAFATIYGLAIRLLYGMFGDILSVMGLGFFVLGPFAIGFLTILLLPRKKMVSNGAAFFWPWITCLLLLVITIALRMEGAICWIMAYPLFAVVAGVGGIIANKLRRKKFVDTDDPENLEKWTGPDKLTVSLILLMPVIFGMGEGGRLFSRKEMRITRYVTIQANPETIFRAIATIDSIKPSATHGGVATLVGFPKHTSTTLDTLATGGKRKAIYEKGLYFDETIRRYEPGKLLVLDIKTDPVNIPPSVMDEHIVIGGKHVDILQDIYEVASLGEGAYRLGLTSHFFINTAFNWYAGIWAGYLMGDILNGELELVKKRSDEISSQQKK